MTRHSEENRTARKKHQCDACYGTIYKGERYNRQISYDDTVYVFKTCPDCLTIVDDVTSDVREYPRFDDEGIFPDDFYEWSENRPDDPRAQRFLHRWDHGRTNPCQPLF